MINSTSGRLATYLNSLLSTDGTPYRPETHKAHYLCCMMVLLIIGIFTWVLQVYIVHYTSLIYVEPRTCS